MSERLTDGAVAAVTAGELARLRAENARLLRLLKLTRREAAPPGPAQAGFFEAPPGPVHAGSPVGADNAFTSCGLRILVDQAAEPVESSDADGERCRVGHARRQSAEDAGGDKHAVSQRAASGGHLQLRSAGSVVVSASEIAGYTGTDPMDVPVAVRWSVPEALLRRENGPPPAVRSCRARHGGMLGFAPAGTSRGGRQS